MVERTPSLYLMIIRRVLTHVSLGYRNAIYRRPLDRQLD